MASSNELLVLVNVNDVVKQPGHTEQLHVWKGLRGGLQAACAKCSRAAGSQCVFSQLGVEH